MYGYLLIEMITRNYIPGCHKMLEAVQPSYSSQYTYKFISLFRLIIYIIIEWWLLPLINIIEHQIKLKFIDYEIVFLLMSTRLSLILEKLYEKRANIFQARTKATTKVYLLYNNRKVEFNLLVLGFILTQVSRFKEV